MKEIAHLGYEGGEIADLYKDTQIPTNDLLAVEVLEY